MFSPFLGINNLLLSYQRGEGKELSLVTQISIIRWIHALHFHRPLSFLDTHKISIRKSFSTLKFENLKGLACNKPLKRTLISTSLAIFSFTNLENAISIVLKWHSNTPQILSYPELPNEHPSKLNFMELIGGGNHWGWVSPCNFLDQQMWFQSSINKLKGGTNEGICGRSPWRGIKINPSFKKMQVSKRSLSVQKFRHSSVTK